MTSVLEKFLLFEITSWVKYGNIILKFSAAATLPIFIFSLIYNLSGSQNPDPTTLLKRWIIVFLVISFVPNYYDKVVGLGMEIGKTLIKEQRGGLIGNWNKVEARILSKLKGQKKELGIGEVVAGLFSFDPTKAVEKVAAIIIFVCVLLIKIIYSTVYYATYSSIGILCALSIFPPYKNHIYGALNSVMYLIITPILISLVLVFMNESLNFELSKDGLLFGFLGIAKFMALCVVLLGCLKIGFLLVRGGGPEGWAAGMGQILSAGMAYKMMNFSKLMAASSGKAAVKTSLFSGAAGASIGSKLYNFASRPLSAGLNEISLSIAEKKGKITENLPKTPVSNTGSFDKNTSINDPNSWNSAPMNQEKREVAPVTYADTFRSLSQNSEKSISAANSLNIKNHFKSGWESSKSSVIGAVASARNSTKEKIGLPGYSNQLSFKEKTIFMADKVLNNPSKNMNDEIQKNIQAKRIADHIDKIGKEND